MEEHEPEEMEITYGSVIKSRLFGVMGVGGCAGTVVGIASSSLFTTEADGLVVPFEVAPIGFDAANRFFVATV